MEYTITPENASDQTITWKITTLDNGVCTEPTEVQEIGIEAIGIQAVVPNYDDYATIDEEGLLSAHMSYEGECNRLAVSASVADLETAATSGFDIITLVSSLTILDVEDQDAGASIDMPDCSSYQLGVTVNPENASNGNVTWTSDNTDVLTVDATGNLSLKGSLPTPTNTTVKITVTANDGSGVSDTVEVVVTFNGC